MKFVSFNQLPLYVDDFVWRDLDTLTKKDALVIHNPQDAIVISPVFLKSRKSLKENIEYIQTNNVKKAIVIANDIQFLTQCPSLEYLWVLPSIDASNFDYSPIYTLPNIKWLRCETTTGLDDKQVATVDYSQFKELRSLSINGVGHQNVALAGNILSLAFDFGYPKAKDLQNTLPGKVLQNLAVRQAPILSVSGIETASQLRRLDLSYNRRLADISALRSLKETLVCLEIDTCGEIQDFSVLEELQNLEYLILKGSNTLPNISFLKHMPKLKYLHVTMNIADGDLSLCEHLPYVRIQNRKHYSHRNQDLPKKYSNPDEAYPFNAI